MIKGFITGFKLGFVAPLKAIPLIVKTPKILMLVLIPLSINIALYVLFFTYGSEYLDSLIQKTVTDLGTRLPQWASFLSVITDFLLKILSWLLLIAVSALTFTTVSSILAAPFNELLSAKTEETVRNMKPQNVDLSVVESISIELKRSSILILGSIGAFIIGLVPLMQIPALCIGALLLSFEYFGITLGRKERGVLSSLKFTLKNIPVSLGFGFFLFLIMALPFTSIVYIPLAVVSGAMIVSARN